MTIFTAGASNIVIPTKAGIQFDGLNHRVAMAGLDSLRHKAYTIIGGWPSGQGAKARSCHPAMVPCNLKETF